jgi:hypothetical protein
MPRWLFCRLLILFCALAVGFQVAFAAPPYKIIISGPGIDGEIEVWQVWLAADERLLSQLDNGLTPGNAVRLAGVPAPVYEIDWYFGRCWQFSEPCTDDPDEVTIHHSRYALDTSSGIGYITHDSDLGAWAGYDGEWYPVSEEFNRTLQLLLIEIYTGLRS